MTKDEPEDEEVQLCEECGDELFEDRTVCELCRSFRLRREEEERDGR